MKLTEKEIHDMEQGAQIIKDHFIPALRTYFEGCMENGFTREEALELTKTYMTVSLSSNKQ
jgi:hypothetical protein